MQCKNITTKQGCISWSAVNKQVPTRQKCVVQVYIKDLLKEPFFKGLYYENQLNFTIKVFLKMSLLPKIKWN